MFISFITFFLLAKIGKIISNIYDGGFKITSMKMVFLERPYCEEFYEVYRGVVPEYVVKNCVFLDS